MRTATLSRTHILSRVLVSIAGGWLFTWGFISLSISGAFGLGMPYAEAYALAMLLAMPLFLGVFCWAYAAARIGVVWAVLVGGGLLTSGLGHLLTQRLAG